MKLNVCFLLISISQEVFALALCNTRYHLVQVTSDCAALTHSITCLQQEYISCLYWMLGQLVPRHTHLTSRLLIQSLMLVHKRVGPDGLTVESLIKRSKAHLFAIVYSFGSLMMCFKLNGNQRGAPRRRTHPPLMFSKTPPPMILIGAPVHAAADEEKFGKRRRHEYALASGLQLTERFAIH